MIEKRNESIVKFKDHKVDGKLVPAKALRALAEIELSGLPVVLRVGAIDYKLGMLHRVRKGREEMFGDLILEVDGFLEFEPVKDEKGKISTVKPLKFVYQKEKPE